MLPVLRRRKKDAYHHGDLQSAAVAAAVDIINEDGLEAISMRKVAERAGVTHGALYQHFDDKRFLLSAVSEDGYRRLARRMRAAQRRIDDPLERIRALAVAYVYFAADEPAHFRITSEPELTCGADEYPALWEAHDVVVELIAQAVDEAQRVGALGRGEPRTVAMTLWTFTHGYAETGRTRRGFFHELAAPPKGKAAIKRHFLAVFEPVLRGLARAR